MVIVKLFAWLLFLTALPLNSSAVMESTASKILTSNYDKIFRPVGATKAVRRLANDGGQILISKSWVGNKIKRLKLVAQYTDVMGNEQWMDELWLQPSLVHFMKDDQVLLKWHRDALFAFGLTDTIQGKLE